MSRFSKRRARFVALCVATSMLAGCALPRSGPTKNEIFSGAVQRQGDSFVVTVDDQVTALTSVVPALGFAEGLTKAAVIGSDMIRPGDTIDIDVTLKDQVSNAFFMTGKVLLAGKVAARLDFACSVAETQKGGPS